MLVLFSPSLEQIFPTKIYTSNETILSMSSLFAGCLDKWTECMEYHEQVQFYYPIDSQLIHRVVEF